MTPPIRARAFSSLSRSSGCFSAHPVATRRWYSAGVSFQLRAMRDSVRAIRWQRREKRRASMLIG